MNFDIFIPHCILLTIPKRLALSTKMGYLASLQNWVYITTGSNTGLGREPARHVARLGAAKIILAVRTMSKGEATVADIVRITDSKASRFEVWPLDLRNFESVKVFGERVQRL